MVRNIRSKPNPGYRRYRCVSPGFDNSARRAKDATILINNTPEAYGQWLRKTILEERSSSHPDDEKLVFINAWNEWAEGAYLEPDRRFGHSFLQAHLNALEAEYLVERKSAFPE